MEGAGHVCQHQVPPLHLMEGRACAQQELLRCTERVPTNLVTTNRPGIAILFIIPGEDFQHAPTKGREN